MRRIKSKECKSKQEILDFLKVKGLPLTELKSIDFHPGMSGEDIEDSNLIEFHNHLDMPETILVYMKDGNEWSVDLYLDSNYELDNLVKRSFTLID